MNKMSQNFSTCVFAVAPEPSRMTRGQAPAMRAQETDRAKSTGSGPPHADGKKTERKTITYK
jgi:hypothetical protein